MNKVKKTPGTPPGVPQRFAQGPGGGGARYDGSGHVNPEHAAHLLALANETKNAEPRTFIEAGNPTDSLAEELAEEAVIAMTSGQDDLTDERDAPVEEERGGPFVVSSASAEFAEGTDDSNISDATREPFPTT
jgi:hypothetical protein